MPSGGKRPGSGRKKGTPNKVSATVKENVIAVFDALGGDEFMIKWAKANPSEFFKLYGKMLPKEIESENKHTGEWTVTFKPAGGK